MDKVLQEIRTLEKNGNPDELGGYLINLVKSEVNAIRYESEFSKHLQSDYWYLKKAAVFALLFALQIDNRVYRKAAIDFIKNPQEDEEVRRWSAAGLGVTYQKTKDKELLKLLIDIVDTPEEESVLKASLLGSALLIYGLSSREQFFRQPSILTPIDKMKEIFKVEMDLMRQIIS